MGGSNGDRPLCQNPLTEGRYPFTGNRSAVVAHELKGGVSPILASRWIADYYGNLGLFAIGAVYAIFPALLFAATAWWMHRRSKTIEAWQSGMKVYYTVLGASLCIDVVLGLPLFTTG